MATAEAAVVEARRWIGVAELPGQPRNRVPGITDWYGVLGAWCDMWVMRVLTNAGVEVGPGPKGAAWVSTTIAWYRAQGRAFTDARQAQPGDLVAFEWGTTGGPRDYDHIGIVEEVRPDGLVTIEGNVGDRVQRLWRAWDAGFAEFAHPHYDPAPADPQSEEDDDMAMTSEERAAFIEDIAEACAVRTTQFNEDPTRDGWKGVAIAPADIATIVDQVAANTGTALDDVKRLIGYAAEVSVARTAAEVVARIPGAQVNVPALVAELLPVVRADLADRLTGDQ